MAAASLAIDPFALTRYVSTCGLTIGYGLLRQAQIGEQRERLQSGIRPVGERHG